MDRGANGGIIGNDARVFHVHLREVDVTGIDNHELNSLKLVDAAAKVMTNKGPVIGIFRQFAYHGVNRTIHSAGQFEAYKNHVDDRSMKVGGTQCIRTNDGYVLPIDIINGLPYFKMQPHTNDEWNTLPHLIFTGGNEWNPRVLDNVISDQPDWYDKLKLLEDGLIKTPFDEFGNYIDREPHVPVVVQPVIPNSDVDEPACDDGDSETDVVLEHHLHDSTSLREVYRAASQLNDNYVVLEAEYSPPEELAKMTLNDLKARKQATPDPLEVSKKKIDYDEYRPYFIHADKEKIRKTFQNTTQFATNVMSGHRILQTIKSPYPAHNVWRRNEAVASDTIFAQVAAIGTNGQKMAQIFVGRTSLVIDIFGMSSEKQFVNTLEDVIRSRGAMDKLITDSAKVEISKRIGEILRALCIDDWQSEPHYQHQNFAEHRWKFYKRNIQWFMNFRDVPAYAWLLCAEWIADVMNHTAEKSLNWRPPLQVLTGQTVDISILLCFLFWDVVYVTRHKDTQYMGQIGSKKSSEIRGRFVGFSKHVGHALTFKILTDDTRQIIHRSRLRLGKDGENNLKLDTAAGKYPERVYIQSKRDLEGDDVVLPTIDMSQNPFNVPDDHLPASIPVVNEPLRVIAEPRIEEADGTGLIVTKVPAPAVTESDVNEVPTTEVPAPAVTQLNGQVSSILDKEHGEQPNTPSILAKDPGEQTTTPEVPTPVVTTVDEESEEQDGEKEYSSPMEDPPLKDTPEPSIKDIDEKELGPGTKVGEKETIDLVFENLRTDNATVGGLHPDQLIDRTFLMPPQEDGTRHRAKIVKRINDYKDGLLDDPDRAAEIARFKCIVNADHEEVVAYSDIVDYIEQDDSWDGVWKFKEILAHKNDVKKTDPMYMGCSVNVQVLWETGEISWEPLTRVDKTGVYNTDPVTVGVYADKHGLLDAHGWRIPGLKKQAKTQK